MPHIQLGRLLVGSIILAIVGVGGLIGINPGGSAANMRIDPRSSIYEVGETFTATVIVNSSIPTNVFSGVVEFNNDLLAVESIDYNTSVADLWAIEPWYSNGDGTVGFAGGTTDEGGFVGEEVLISINFRTLAEGSSQLSLRDARILRHDGLGTDITLATPIDSVFTVEPEELDNKTVTYRQRDEGRVGVVKEKPSTDLNSDGKQNLVDSSIFMTHLASQNLRSDFNGDGKVNLTDLSILNR